VRRAGAARLRELGVRHRLPAPALEQLGRYLELLALPHAPTAVHDAERGVEVHLADSLAALDLAPVGRARHAADLGSGAGLPGLPLAVAMPALEVFLVESAARKAEWLGQTCHALGVGNVRVVNRRAESWPEGAGAMDLVTVRAVAEPAVVLEYGAPLLRLGGSVLDWRTRGAGDGEGDTPGAEIRAVAELLGLRFVERVGIAPSELAGRHVIDLYLKVRETPAGFPRRPGMARKRPLRPSTRP
jgi:16S rRNA (guanine527-N7)-methyltransferase